MQHPKKAPLKGELARAARRRGLLFPGRKNFYQKNKLLVKESKTWYDNSNEANNKAGHGRFAVTHAPMQESTLLHNSICYASSYYNSLPIFFQYLVFHLLTTEDCLFHNTGFVFALMRCGVIISCTAFCLSRRETVRRDAGVKARPVRGHPGEILCPYGRSRREGEVW